MYIKALQLHPEAFLQTTYVSHTYTVWQWRSSSALDADPVCLSSSERGSVPNMCSSFSLSVSICPAWSVWTLEMYVCVCLCVSVHTVEFCVSMFNSVCSLSLDLFLPSCLFLPPVSLGSLKNDCEHLTYSCIICMLAFLCLFSISSLLSLIQPLLRSHCSFTFLTLVRCTAVYLNGLQSNKCEEEFTANKCYILAVKSIIHPKMKMLQMS